jgi:hypothetical protein
LPAGFDEADTFPELIKQSAWHKRSLLVLTWTHRDSSDNIKRVALKIVWQSSTSPLAANSSNHVPTLTTESRETYDKDAEKRVAPIPNGDLNATSADLDRSVVAYVCSGLHCSQLLQKPFLSQEYTLSLTISRSEGSDEPCKSRPGRNLEMWDY